MVKDNNGQPADLELVGRTILVVGAAQGIGHATAKRLAGLGATVFMADRQDCTEVAKAIGPNATPISIDLTDTDRIEAVIAEVGNRAGPLYGLVNCAGLLVRTELEVLEKSTVEQEMAVNQVGALYLTRAAMAAMRPHGEGRIVLFTSQGAFTGGYLGSINYAMTKAAVGALIKSMARIGAPDGVTVNAIAPGGVDTAMLRDGISDQDLEWFKQKIPLGRFADPDEMATIATFLLSRWASYITGSTIHANGGQLMI